MTSGLVSSSTLPSSCIPAPAASSCCGFSSGGRVNMYGVWHVPTAATISPMVSLLPSRVFAHRRVDPVEQRHRRQTAGRARFGLAPLADRAGELDVLAIEGGDGVERHLLALAVRHRITVHLERLLFADVSIKAAKWSLVVERH